MPTRELGDLLKRLKEEAASALIEKLAPRRSRAGKMPETDWRLRVGFETCGQVLGDLEATA
jgi:hypothetical protein